MYYKNFHSTIIQSLSIASSTSPSFASPIVDDFPLATASPLIDDVPLIAPLATIPSLAVTSPSVVPSPLATLSNSTAPSSSLTAANDQSSSDLLQSMLKVFFNDFGTKFANMETKVFSRLTAVESTISTILPDKKFPRYGKFL